MKISGMVETSSARLEGKRGMAGKFSVAVVGIVLAGALSLQVSRRHLVTESELRLDVTACVPSELSGWIVRDEPLGPTERASASALKVLENPQYVYRTYRRESTWFSIYIAYWRQRADTVPLVLEHTPEHCWSSAGMRCVDFENKRTLRLRGVALPPAEWRAFVAPDGGRAFVLYWMYHGNELYDWGRGLHGFSAPHLSEDYHNILVRWGYLVKHSLYGRRDQCFIRVAANVPFEELVDASGFVRAMAHIAAAGLVGKK